MYLYEILWQMHFDSKLLCLVVPMGTTWVALREQIYAVALVNSRLEVAFNIVGNARFRNLVLKVGKTPKRVGFQIFCLKSIHL